MGDVGGEVVRQAPAALAGLVVGDQDTQARAGALGDLAELLRRPPEARAELLAVHVQRDLAGEHEPLVGGQLVGELAQAAHVVTTGQARGHVGRWIGNGGEDGSDLPPSWSTAGAAPRGSRPGSGCVRSRRADDR